MWSLSSSLPAKMMTASTGRINWNLPYFFIFISSPWGATKEHTLYITELEPFFTRGVSERERESRGNASYFSFLTGGEAMRLSWWPTTHLALTFPMGKQPASSAVIARLAENSLPFALKSNSFSRRRRSPFFRRGVISEETEVNVLQFSATHWITLVHCLSGDTWQSHLR